MVAEDREPDGAPWPAEDVRLITRETAVRSTWGGQSRPLPIIGLP